VEFHQGNAPYRPRSYIPHVRAQYVHDLMRVYRLPIGELRMPKGFGVVWKEFLSYTLLASLLKVQVRIGVAEARIQPQEPHLQIRCPEEFENAMTESLTLNYYCFISKTPNTYDKT
jgi:hypothetical protein